MPRWPKGHVSKRTCPECGSSKDFYAELCRNCRDRAGWPTPLAGVVGEDHPAWKGGLMEDRDGYVRTYAPDHPWPRAGGYVLEHVRVVELKIGRRLRPDECVHHIDHNRQNNDIENLELMKRGRHSRLHRKMDSHLRDRDERGRFS